MPDDTRTQMIEGRIDKSVLSGLPVAVSPTGGMTVMPRNFTELLEFSKAMATAGPCIRMAFQNRPGPCLALTLQALRWGFDPFAVANKAYITKSAKTGEEQIAYESQLIHAVINGSSMLSRRLRVAYSGQGQQRKCVVTGWVKGEDDPLEYESPAIAQIGVKNSPLWSSDPDQQLHYYATRAWARRWLPEVLLGVYSLDEVDSQIIDVTADRIDAHAAGVQEVEARKTFVWQATDHTGEVYDFRTPERAVEACRKILISAAGIGPDTLATAWENNEHLRETLIEAEYGSDAAALDRLYAELAPPEPDSPVEPQPEQKGEATTGKPPRSDTPAEGTPTEAAGDTSRTPFVEPAEKEKDATSTAESPTPSGTGSGADLSQFQGTPQPQTAEQHDPFWDRESLRIDVPLNRAGKPDWRVWPALLTPRIRQAWSIPLLNALHEDNAGLLDEYASNIGSRPRDEIVGLFEDARERLST